MLRVGLAGVGFMGWIHYLAYKNVTAARLAAVCSRDEKKLAGDWRGIKGNFGPPGEQIDLSGVGKHRDLASLLADPEVDLIDICLPPHLHAETALAALRAGKHVFCEKPMALTTADCEAMVAAAEKAGKQLLIGHVLPFFPEYAKAREIIAGGQYGKLLGGHFKRVISDPLWLHDFYDPNKVGGPLVDLHVHDAHLIRFLFGMPKAVVSQGRMRGDVVEYCESQFQFADETLVVSAASGVIRQQGRGFTHGFEMHLERATLQYEFAAFGDGAELMPLKLLTDDGGVVRPDLGEADSISAFVAEIEEVARAVSTGRPSPLLGGDLARDAIVLCHRQTESVRKHRPVDI